MSVVKSKPKTMTLTSWISLNSAFVLANSRENVFRARVVQQNKKNKLSNCSHTPYYVEITTQIQCSRTFWADPTPPRNRIFREGGRSVGLWHEYFFSSTRYLHSFPPRSRSKRLNALTEERKIVVFFHFYFLCFQPVVVIHLLFIHTHTHTPIVNGCAKKWSDGGEQG